MYYPHNIHFQWAAASMEGRSTEALVAARRLVTQAPAEMVRQMPIMEFVSPTLLFTLARFGKWDEILKEPAPPEDLQYTTGVWHYVRGLAFAAKGQFNEAEKEQSSVVAAAAALPPGKTLGDNMPAEALLRIAASTLAGEIAARRGQTDEAVRQLEEAVRLQDKLPYTEPPPWYYPVRQSLGAVLLAAGRAADAEKVYYEDLQRNPENGWSLYGLVESFRAQKADAAAVEQRFQKAWARADVKLTASRF
jgi:tetratricopeptide (TPR) repeat protein